MTIEQNVLDAAGLLNSYSYSAYGVVLVFTIIYPPTVVYPCLSEKKTIH